MPLSAWSCREGAGLGVCAIRVQYDLHQPAAWEAKDTSNWSQCLVKRVCSWVCGFLKAILTSCQGMPYILSLFALWSLLFLQKATETAGAEMREADKREAGTVPGSLAL